MLRFTGHPLYDVGVATLTAFADKDDPAELTEADLAGAAQYMATEYVRQPLKSFLTVAFPNSGFTNPAFEKTPERRDAYARVVLTCYQSSTPRSSTEACVFSGEPAIGIPLKDGGDLPPGRGFRQHVPLLTGEGVINFYPYGDAGIPMSGEATLAIQAFPLGCAKCGGRLLAVHSDNPELTLHFARQFLRENRTAVELAHATGSTKLREAAHKQRTLLIKTLLEAERMRTDAVSSSEGFSLTAYHLTNSGQGAALDIYHLPMQVVSFLSDMRRADYRSQWDAIVQRAWEVPPKPRGKEAKVAQDEAFTPSRNWLYEDLFDLPLNARQFLRTYFLRLALRNARAAGDPRTSYSLRNEVVLVSWSITDRFLWRVMDMDKQRIEQIRELGDRLADYVATDNDRGFFREFFTTQRYQLLRASLLKANLAAVRRGKPPLIELDPYIAIFEDGEEVPSLDWSLARDLVLIRMVEQLYKRGWLGRNVEVLPETTSGEAESPDTTSES